MLTVVVKEPGKTAEIRNIETKDVLKTCQQLVGGYVEQVGIGPGVNILCNEDGLAMKLPDNCGFVGTLVFVQDRLVIDEYGDETYDWGSLSEENIHKAKAWCQRYEGAAHPNRSGKPRIISGKEAISYREQLTKIVHEKIAEWKSL